MQRITTTITRLEGASDECDIPFTFENFADANRQLATWAKTAPEGGCYDKVNVRVNFDDSSYSFRLDLKRDATPSVVRELFATRDWYNSADGMQYSGPEARAYLDSLCNAILDGVA